MEVGTLTGPLHSLQSFLFQPFCWRQMVSRLILEYLSIQKTLWLDDCTGAHVLWLQNEPQTLGLHHRADSWYCMMCLCKLDLVYDQTLALCSKGAVFCSDADLGHAAMFFFSLFLVVLS